MDSDLEVTDADVVDEVKRMLKRHCNVTEYKIKVLVCISFFELFDLHRAIFFRISLARVSTLFSK